VIHTRPQTCTPPLWPATWPCDYCGQPVTPARNITDLGDGTIYTLHGVLGAWHDDCRTCLGGPRP
jgi:hypothetical protein